MQFDFILASLRHHRTFALIIIAQVAICVAIVGNGAYFVEGRLDRIGMESGLVEDQIVRVRPVNMGEIDNPDALTEADLKALREIPGVVSASHTSMVPMSESDDALPLRLDPSAKAPLLHATVYYGTHDLIETMGLQLIAGRSFAPEDEVAWPREQSAAPAFPHAIVTTGLANSLFPDQNPLGKVFYSDDGQPVRIIGVVRWLKRGYVLGDPSTYDHSLILPTSAGYTRFYGHYLLRTSPDMRERVLDAAVAALSKIERRRIIFSKDSFEDIRSGYFSKDRVLAIALAGICIALLAVASFGILGISSFWVQKRTSQIGIRRALGSTRAGVLAYFHTENLLLVGAGALLGIVLCYVLNGYLMDRYEFSRLPAVYALACAGLTIALGQLAVLLPAAKAASVPPSIALRML